MSTVKGLAADPTGVEADRIFKRVQKFSVDDTRSGPGART
jgi:hypothetical protein